MLCRFANMYVKLHNHNTLCILKHQCLLRVYRVLSMSNICVHNIQYIPSCRTHYGDGTHDEGLKPRILFLLDKIDACSSFNY